MSKRVLWITRKLGDTIREIEDTTTDLDGICKRVEEIIANSDNKEKVEELAKTIRETLKFLYFDFDEQRKLKREELESWANFERVAEKMGDKMGS